jgi:hypothetical protein
MAENNQFVPTNPVCGPTGVCSCLLGTIFCTSSKITTFPGFLPTDSVQYLKVGDNNLAIIWPNAFAATLLEIDAGKNRLAAIPRPPQPLMELERLDVKVWVFD